MEKITLTPEIREEITKFILEYLHEGFQDKFVFDPVVIAREVDQYGDDYLRIWIVFDGNQDNLDPERTLALRVHLADTLDGMGIWPSFSTSYMGVDEWKYYGRGITERAGA